MGWCDDYSFAALDKIPESLYEKVTFKLRRIPGVGLGKDKAPKTERAYG